MAGAAPTAKPAPFLRPLDAVDRGVLLAESALSLVVVVLMLFAAVAESSSRLLQPLGSAGRVVLFTILWLGLVASKLAGSPASPAPAVALARRWFKSDARDDEPASRRRAVFLTTAAFVPVAAMLGYLTSVLARGVVAYAGDILMHGTIWAAFLGASFATRGRRHLAIDALSRLLPDRGRRAVVALSTALGGFIAFTLAKGVYDSLHHAAIAADETARDLAAYNATSGTVDRSYQFQYIIPVGFTLIGIRLLLHSFHEFVACFAGSAGETSGPVSPPAEAPSSVDPARASTDESKPRAAVATATWYEILIGVSALAVAALFARGTTVAKPLAMLTALAALVLVVPLVLRRARTGSFAPEGREQAEPVRGRAMHFVLAALCVAAIEAGMAYGLAPRVGSIPVGWGVAFFAVMALLGAPLFSFLGGLGLFLFVKLFLASDSPLTRANAFTNSFEDVLGNHFARMSVLATIPLFTLAGYIMSESRMPQRLVRVSRALLGWMPGGLAVVCVFASAFFTIFSGASGITIVAVGGLLLPALLKDRYPEKFSMGLVTTGGALGITVPPCLPLIVYGIVAGLQEPAPGQERLELQKFLVAGLLPGLVAIGLMVLYCIAVGAISKVPRSKFDAREAGSALWEAKWELLLPVVLLVGLVKGIFNPSQAAAFTAFYVVIIEVFIYKDLSVRADLPRIVPESMVLVGAIFVKLAAATVLVGYFVQAQTADKLFEWLTCGPPAREYMHQHAATIGTCREAVDALARAGQGAGGLIDSKLSFLIALNVFLLIVGMLMDIFSAIVVVVPLIAGIAMHFHINPYHLGIVFLLNLEIGYLMPPMGLNLFIAGFRFNRPVPDLYRMVGPFIALFVVALMIVTYMPSLTTAMIPRSRGSMTTTSQGTETSGPNSLATNANGGDAGTAANSALPPPGDCDVPRDDEDPTAFETRCNLDFDGDGLIGGRPASDAGTAGGDGSATAPAEGALPTPRATDAAAGAVP